jgi:hypothetical protein
MAHSISDFTDVDVSDCSYGQVLLLGVDQAALLSEHPGARTRLLDLALAASIGSVNALLAASAAICQRSQPPAEIDMISDGSGKLIYRCHHLKPHKWNLTGDIV